MGAQVVMPSHPGQLSAGYAPVLDCHTAHVAVRFGELISRIDRKTGKELEKAPKTVKAGDSCMVKMVPTKPMCIEAFAEYPAMGRFTLRDLNRTVGIGIVKQVNKRAMGGRAGPTGMK